MGVVAAGRAAGIVTDDDELAVGEDDQVGEIDLRIARVDPAMTAWGGATRAAW